MNTIYLIVLQEPSEHAWHRLAQTWTSKYVIDDRTALVCTPPSSTSQEVSAVLGMDGEHNVRGIVVQMDRFFGFHNRDIWEWIEKSRSVA